MQSLIHINASTHSLYALWASCVSWSSAGVASGSEKPATKEENEIALNSNNITWIGNSAAIIGTTVEEYKKYGPPLNVDIGTNEKPTMAWIDTVRKAYQDAMNNGRNELFVIWAKAHIK